ncbi:MAG TPA: hypothetical protein VJN94_16145, partial [Candidatus Binataceae bacterium]|nr:hypothetical protein [Candidatus Binataceae bacterium]
MATVILAFTHGVALPNSTANDPAAILVARARIALGPGLGRVKSLHMVGTISSGDINGTTESWCNLADGLYLSKINAGPLTAARGYDGRTAWASDSKGIVLPQTGPLARRFAATEIFEYT